MWYVIQTAVNQEIKLIEEIRGMVNSSTYNSCFVIKAESMRRREGRQFVHEAILFTGYVFVDTDTPTAFYEALKTTFSYSKMLAEENKVDDNSFLPVREEEQEILEALTGENEACPEVNKEPRDPAGKSKGGPERERIVRLSLVRKIKSNGKFVAVYGPLSGFNDKITDIDFHHRRAFITVEVAGRPKRVMLGIATEQDLIDNGLKERLAKINEEIKKTEAAEAEDRWNWKAPEKGTPEIYEKPEKFDSRFEGIGAGTWVRISSGLYGDGKFLVKSTNPDKGTVKVAMQMFGNEMEVEMGIGEVEAVE